MKADEGFNPWRLLWTVFTTVLGAIVGSIVGDVVLSVLAAASRRQTAGHGFLEALSCWLVLVNLP
jgi:uncharacterized membrane protein YeaQ/YmgE (transglycosylase-associated protein family)